MRSTFSVLSEREIDAIHSASMEILAETGLKVDFKKARNLFREAGCKVNDEAQSVCIPEELVLWAVEKAPSSFNLYGRDAGFNIEIGGNNLNFAALGTPTSILDNRTGEYRQTGFDDLLRHIKLIDACRYINGTQMDIWPNDIPMTTIHTEAIKAWAYNSKKPFGMGCYGYIPTLDMMKLTAITVGGKSEMCRKPRFFAICSVVSPLQMNKEQIEGMLICADYGQPVAMSPEAIAGATAPATLAGLLVQENAAILAHITLAQIFRPGTPVLYGTVSTIANMRLGTVALGAVETGLISAASVQLAHRYGLPVRTVGATTESKREDIQAGLERSINLIQAAIAGANYITCGGTLDSTMLESEALLLIDDELCGMVQRLAKGIEVSQDTLAVDLIKKVGFKGHYLAEEHTASKFRSEHYIPDLLVREPYSTWVNNGSKLSIDLAKEKVEEVIAAHKPQQIDPELACEIDQFCRLVADRELNDFYLGEQEENQDFNNL